MHPKKLSIQDFTYTLPDERIARYPLEERDSSKLLIYKEGEISESVYAQITDQLPANSFLVFNNTKVIEARLIFEKSNGSKIEIFCLEPHTIYGDITTGMLQKGSVLWKCLVGGAKKWKEGSLTLQVPNSNLILTAAKQQVLSDGYLIEFSWNQPAASFAEVLHLAGAIPLPPYLNRTAEESDSERYQTIYAKQDGSVAAPTAGLHFTEKVFNSLQYKNIGHGFVTLHVGAGTFKPVKSERMEEHEMHAEFIDVSADFIHALRLQIEQAHCIIPVGTTSLRTLESLYWIATKISRNPSATADELQVKQWEPYEMIQEAQQLQPSEALSVLLKWMQAQQTEKLITKTQIILAPGYRFRIAHALITNFHQPQSTLLLLVSAIVGEKWKDIYQYALEHDFRFLSYGDGNLLWI